MSTINTGIATSSFMNNFANTGDISGLQRAVSKSFNSIDNVAEGRRDDTVGFSSKSQFMLNLQTYAYSLSDEERNQFVDVLEQSDDEMFDKKLLEFMRNPPSADDYTFVTPPEMQARMNEVGPMDGSGSVDPEGLIVQYSGPILIGAFGFQAIPHSGDIHETDHLDSRLDQLTNKASQELSKQDLATLTGTMEVSVKSSQNYLHTTYSLFRTNYDYEIAAKAIEELPLSDGLKEGYKNFLSDIKEFQNERITDSIEKVEKQIQELPQYENMLRDEVRAKEESLAINKELQESLSHSKNGLLENEKYFQLLIDKADFIDKDMSIAPELFNMIGSTYGFTNEDKTIPGMFEHYQDQYEAFDRRFIEKDWTVDKQSLDDPSLNQAFEETHELTNQYITAINAYMANFGMS